tara:strand:+ start:249 stop:629 length:381 start_codon:yes stop_codon:yes gene_type:complete
MSMSELGSSTGGDYRDQLTKFLGRYRKKIVVISVEPSRGSEEGDTRVIVRNLIMKVEKIASDDTTVSLVGNPKDYPEIIQEVVIPVEREGFIIKNKNEVTWYTSEWGHISLTVYSFTKMVKEKRKK